MNAAAAAVGGETGTTAAEVVVVDDVVALAADTTSAFAVKAAVVDGRQAAGIEIAAAADSSLTAAGPDFAVAEVLEFGIAVEEAEAGAAPDISGHTCISVVSDAGCAATAWAKPLSATAPEGVARVSSADVDVTIAVAFVHVGDGVIETEAGGSWVVVGGGDGDRQSTRRTPKKLHSMESLIFSALSNWRLRHCHILLVPQKMKIICGIVVGGYGWRDLILHQS